MLLSAAAAAAAAELHVTTNTDSNSDVNQLIKRLATAIDNNDHDIAHWTEASLLYVVY